MLDHNRQSVKQREVIEELGRVWNVGRRKHAFEIVECMFEIWQLEEDPKHRDAKKHNAHSNLSNGPAGFLEEPQERTLDYEQNPVQHSPQGVADTGPMPKAAERHDDH